RIRRGGHARAAGIFRSRGNRGSAREVRHRSADAQPAQRHARQRFWLRRDQRAQHAARAGAGEMKTTAFLIALATAIPAAAQTDRFTLRPYGMITEQAFSAQTTFKAIFGQSAEPLWGAGAQLILRKNIYIDVSASRFKKTGQRAFINNGQTFRLGIPLTATLTPFEVTGGYRFRLRRH